MYVIVAVIVDYNAFAAAIVVAVAITNVWIINGVLIRVDTVVEVVEIVEVDTVRKSIAR
jgi:hypothetical protein